VRAGYRALLKTAPEIELVAEAPSGEQGYLLFFQHHPDIVIMDLSLPGISGLEAIRRIINRSPAARILAFSMHEDLMFVEQALQAGARGYITKNSAPEVLIEAVRKIAQGDVYMETGIAQKLAYQKSRNRRTPFENLSTREFEIMGLLASGLNIETISRRLALSYKTVANYSTQIKSKLGVSSTAELTRLAIRHSIIQP